MELNALSSARAFIVICGNVRGSDTARILLAAMPRILTVLNQRKGPFMYYVYKNSTIKQAR